MPLLARKQQVTIPDSLQVLTIDVNGIPLRLIRVEGGSFMMGSTQEQYDPDIHSDRPAHLVFLSPFYMAETEVTYQLWHAVMPERETLHPRGFQTTPISYVTWFDCKEFVRRLDSITSLPFRLPTEAEWEFAARGGNNTQYTRFAGSNEPDSVGWTNHCSGNWAHPVARKQPNELGLYDMTGNVSEWCEDWFAPYQLGTPPNPCVQDSGTYKIARGGSYDNCLANSHLSFRQRHLPETSLGFIGFRVAMTLPDDPMMQKPTAEPELTKTVHLKSRKLNFVLVPAETPYYISDEIPASLWRTIMRNEPPEKSKSIAIGMTQSARKQFAEKCSREAKQVLFVASAEQIVAAEQQGLIEPFQSETNNKKRHQTIRQIQRKRRAAKKLSPWTELIGFRLPEPDDPILLQYQKADDDSRPLRLTIPF